MQHPVLRVEQDRVDGDVSGQPEVRRQVVPFRYIGNPAMPRDALTFDVDDLAFLLR
jgi:hypothetical protein